MFSFILIYNQIMNLMKRNEWMDGTDGRMCWVHSPTLDGRMDHSDSEFNEKNLWKINEQVWG